MKKPREFPPKYVACLLDWSLGCEERFLERCGGKVYLSGFYDDNLDTFICSSERMVYVCGIELMPEQYPEDDKEREKLNEELIEVWSTFEPHDDYYQRRFIENRRDKHPGRFKEVQIDLDDPQNERACEEEVRELLSGNPMF